MRNAFMLIGLWTSLAVGQQPSAVLPRSSPTITADAKGSTSALPAGLWYGSARSNGETGSVLRIEAAGKLSHAEAKMVECVYRVQGLKLFLSDTNPGAGLQPETVFDLQITPTTLVMSQLPKIPAITYRRVPANQTNSGTILGEWTTSQPADIRAVGNGWHFRNDGTAVFISPSRWVPGSYSMSADQIKLTFSDTVPVQGQWWMDGPALVLPARSGAQRFRRF